MPNAEHLVIFQKGNDVWCKWREENPQITPDLSNIDLAKADLRGRDLSGTDFFFADLSNANLSGALLRTTDFSGANLTGTNLAGADLFHADFHEATLRGANLRGARLSGVNFMETDLRDADLSGADIRGGTRFFEATLRGANLTEATIHRVSFHDTILTGANLTKASMSWTVFGQMSLSNVKGLESIHHVSGSSVGLDVIYISKGDIPDIFLQGAGVPESFITYMKSLVGSALDFYSCFISYSTKDQDFADRLYADLQSRGVRCWFAPHDIQGGKKIHEQIDEAIRVYDKLLLVLSEHSMKSNWVETEISQARKRELHEQRRMLFPVRLVDFETLRDWQCFDADTGKDSAREIREYYIPDFSNWNTNHAAYREEFDRLLRDLKQSTSTEEKPLK